MPPKKSKGKKSNGYKKKKSYKSKLGKPSKGLTQSTYFFTRKVSNVINLSDTTLSNGGMHHPIMVYIKTGIFNLQN